MVRKSILLVDDEELIRLSLQSNLENEGFRTDIAESAESALEMLKECSYDLLLTDNLMEKMNGIELMRQAKMFCPEIKVIVFSGYEDKDSTNEILGFGANDFLCKPIDFDDLLERILNVLAP